MGLIRKSNRATKTANKKKEQDLQERLNQFHSAYKEISQKYQIDIGVELKYGTNGIIPQLRAIDIIGKEPEHKIEISKPAESAQK